MQQYAADFEFDDLQALVRFGHGQLPETCFMLLTIADAAAAGRWLKKAPISRAVVTEPVPDTAMQIAFSVDGLRVLGLSESVIAGFSDEFITGMAGDESRSRRLGDVGDNAPEYWHWGGGTQKIPHVLLMLYARDGGIEAWKSTVVDEQFSSAFQLLHTLPTDDLVRNEPFGFADGISQPEIDWSLRQSTDLHQRDAYSNWVTPGEFVLGYPNEYGQYTARPLINPADDQRAAVLPNAADEPQRKDLGRNGTYLVIRQLHQDVPGFWQFADRASGSDPEKRELLAAAMVGRKRDGTPLAPSISRPIPGIDRDAHDNHFTYELDPKGHRCPVGAHIRRSNPRTGDFPAIVTGLFNRLVQIFGFGLSRPDQDLIASTRYHRLLRRGRGYGPVLEPEEALLPDAPAAERGLQFIALVASISRQFEFVQNAWAMSSTFGGLRQERDPIIGIRQPLQQGEATDRFNRPDQAGPTQETCCLPQFVTVRGGGYFFMPGLRALQFIAALTERLE